MARRRATRRGRYGLLLALLGLLPFEPALAARRSQPHTTVVVVQRGWPLLRPLRQVVVHPAEVAIRVTPTVFLPVMVWAGIVVPSPPRAEQVVWEDEERLHRSENWTEITFSADSRGSRLWLQMVAGRVQFDWAEVVLDNGETRVVDMKEWARGPGHYELLAFGESRRLDHVRIVARARSENARVVLKIEE